VSFKCWDIVHSYFPTSGSGKHSEIYSDENKNDASVCKNGQDELFYLNATLDGPKSRKYVFSKHDVVTNAIIVGQTLHPKIFLR